MACRPSLRSITEKSMVRPLRLWHADQVYVESRPLFQSYSATTKQPQLTKQRKIKKDVSQILGYIRFFTKREGLISSMHLIILVNTVIADNTPRKNVSQILG